MNFHVKSDYIYEKIKDKIVEGELGPGARIIISDIAKEFDVSAMPVREAVKRLQQDELVEVVPHVGAKVASFDFQKFKELALIRIELETLAAKLSTPFINNEKLKELKEIMSKMEEAVKNKHNLEYARLNKEFHVVIYSASNFGYLYDMIMKLWAKTEVSRTIFTKIEDRSAKSMEEHRQWLKAIEEKNPDKAGEIARMHKVEAFEALFKYFEEKEGKNLK